MTTARSYFSPPNSSAESVRTICCAPPPGSTARASYSISLWSAPARWRPSCAIWLRQLGLPNIYFAGFVNQAALPARVYAACDVFVLPSENETWGLAVNEAMCAGLPIVVSSEIGCAPDLVHDNCNGRTFWPAMPRG